MTSMELEEVSRNIKYEYKKPGEVIYNSCDKADKFYIVLKGKCMIFAPSPDNTDFGLVVKDKKKDVKKESPKKQEEE